MASPEIIAELLRQAFVQRNMPSQTERGINTIQEALKGVLQGIQIFDAVKGLGVKYATTRTIPGTPGVPEQPGVPAAGPSEVPFIPPETPIRTGLESMVSPATLAAKFFPSPQQTAANFSPPVPSTPSTISGREFTNPLVQKAIESGFIPGKVISSQVNQVPPFPNVTAPRTAPMTQLSAMTPPSVISAPIPAVPPTPATTVTEPGIYRIQAESELLKAIQGFGGMQEVARQSAGRLGATVPGQIQTPAELKSEANRQLEIIRENARIKNANRIAGSTNEKNLIEESKVYQRIIEKNQAIMNENIPLLSIPAYQKQYDMANINYNEALGQYQSVIEELHKVKGRKINAKQNNVTLPQSDKSDNDLLNQFLQEP